MSETDNQSTENDAIALIPRWEYRINNPSLNRYVIEGRKVGGVFAFFDHWTSVKTPSAIVDMSGEYYTSYEFAKAGLERLKDDPLASAFQQLKHRAHRPSILWREIWP